MHLETMSSQRELPPGKITQLDPSPQEVQMIQRDDDPPPKVNGPVPKDIMKGKENLGFWKPPSVISIQESASS